MATILAIDDSLIREAQKIGRHKTKKSAVTEALKEYILRRKQPEIVELFGKIEYDNDYDYKAGRIRLRGSGKGEKLTEKLLEYRADDD